MENKKKPAKKVVKKETKNVKSNKVTDISGSAKLVDTVNNELLDTVTKAPEEPVKEVTTESSIHDKYRHYIGMISSGYLHGLQYADAMEILRWMEKKSGSKIPIDYSCANCMFDLIVRFALMEKNK